GQWRGGADGARRCADRHRQSVAGDHGGWRGAFPCRGRAQRTVGGRLYGNPRWPARGRKGGGLRPVPDRFGSQSVQRAGTLERYAADAARTRSPSMIAALIRAAIAHRLFVLLAALTLAM